MKKGFLFVCLLNILFVLCLWPVFLGGLTFSTQHHHMPEPKAQDDCAMACFISSLQLIDTLKSQLSFFVENFTVNYLLLILALGLLVLQIEPSFGRRNFLSPPNFNHRQRQSLLISKINDHLSLAFSQGLINPKLYA